MASPTTELRESLADVLTTEFAAEAFPVKPGRLHPSLGDRGPIAGIFPDDEDGAGELAARTRVTVQVFGRWKKTVDPNHVADASDIEAWAWRFRRAIRGVRVGDGTHVWWFNLLSVRYPPDPTGQITRFEATVEAIGPNAGVVETVA